VVCRNAAAIQFDESGVFWGRVFFVIWLWLCTAIAGRAANRSVRWNLGTPGYMMLSLASLLLLVSMLVLATTKNAGILGYREYEPRPGRC
jgi:hypothetical protein